MVLYIVLENSLKKRNNEKLKISESMEDGNGNWQLTPRSLCGQIFILQTSTDFSMRLDEHILLCDFLNKTKHLQKGLEVVPNFLGILQRDNLGGEGKGNSL